MVGDSHARVFTEPALRALPVQFEVTAISAATASGLTNPNSRTDAGATIAAKLDSAGRARRTPAAILVVLGEVDCGFVIWWHHQQHDSPLDELLERAVCNVSELLARASRIAPALFVSAPLPTIADAADFGEYANLRRDIDASQADRTALVLEFNRRVGAACRELGVRFVDLDSCSLGPDGLVSPLLKDADPHQHHYDQVVYARLLARELARGEPFD